MSDTVAQNKGIHPIAWVVGGLALTALAGAVYLKFFHNADETNTANANGTDNGNVAGNTNGNTKANSNSSSSAGGSGRKKNPTPSPTSNGVAGSNAGTGTTGASTPPKTQTPISSSETTFPNANPLDPELHRKIKSAFTPRGLMYPLPAKVKEWAEKIEDAWHWTGDDEDAVYEVFKAQHDYLSMSMVADYYGRKFGIPLEKDITDRMSHSEKEEALGYINSKPVYRFA